MVTLVAVVALAWSSPAFCGKVHDAARDGSPKNVEALLRAARDGNLKEVRELLKRDPDLVFGKSNDGGTPLHMAAEKGHKDIAELLRQHGGHE
jgi:ankyrin repeat protein